MNDINDIMKGKRPFPIHGFAKNVSQISQKYLKWSFIAVKFFYAGSHQFFRPPLFTEKKLMLQKLNLDTFYKPMQFFISYNILLWNSINKSLLYWQLLL